MARYQDSAKMSVVEDRYPRARELSSSGHAGDVVRNAWLRKVEASERGNAGWIIEEGTEKRD